MANWCLNRAVITHDMKVKVSDLYRISAGDFFNFFLPPPNELCNEDSLKDKDFNLQEYGADNLRSWRINNWGNPSPPILGWIEREMSDNGDYVTLRLDTKWFPAIGIYEELERQGYRVKAYYWEPYSGICGSYIYGVLEHIVYLNADQDIPYDIDMIFGIEENKYWCGNGERTKEYSEDKNSPTVIEYANTSYFEQG